MTATVKARHMKNLLAEAAAGPEGAQVMATLDPALRALVDGAVANEWLDMRVNVALSKGIQQALGDDRARLFWIDVTVKGFDGPLLRPLVSSAIALFGLDVAAFIKLIPRGWDALFRDCGTFEIVERSDTTAVVKASGLPAVCCDDDVWLETVRASFEALFVVSKCTGAVTLGDVDLAEGRALFRFRW